MKKNKTYYLFYTALIILGIIILDLPFGLTPIMFDDSSAYLAEQLPIGVVPGYPLFLAANRKIFGEMYYLKAVVVLQILLNVAASVSLIRYLWQKLNLRWFEALVFFLASFVPHSVFMPTGMSSRMIVTEALAFPVFYFMVICVMEAVWNKKVWYGIGALFLTILLSLVRTQLQLTMVIPIGAIVYALYKNVNGNRLKKFRRLLLGVGIGLLLFAGAYLSYRQINKQMQQIMTVMNQSDREGETGKANIKEPVKGSQNISAQISGVFYSKMMFTAEPDDRELFQNENLARLFDTVYERLLSNDRLLNSMQMDLYIADKIFNRIDGVYSESFEILRECDESLLTEFATSGNILSIFARTIFRNHPLRWLKSGLLQIPSGLISTVFFHKRSFYWFSYLTAFLAYALAIASIAWGIKRKLCTSAVEFMVCTLLINLLFVSASAIVYIALQRYVVYGFGLFYMAWYYLIKQLFLTRSSNKGEENASDCHDSYSGLQ